MSRVTCDDCDVPVSTTGYLGGPIICHDCARERRKEMEVGK